MRTYLRGKVTLLFMMLGMLLAIPAVALAAELVTSELDTTTPNAVTVSQGGSTSFNIGLRATGSISNLITETNASKATVDTAYSLDGSGNFTKNTPSSEFKFFSSGDNPTGTNSVVTWTGAPTPYSVGATISAAATTPTGDYTLSLSPTAGDTSVSNPSVSGGKLEDGTASTITVHVVAPPPPSCTTPADPTFSGTPDGSNGWYKTIPTVSASSTAGATVQYSLNAAGPFSNTAPTLGQGETTVYAKAVSGTCSSDVTSQLYKVDTIAPEINDDGTTQTPNDALWFKAAVVNNFSASDATPGSGLASAASFTKSSGTDEGLAVNINSGPVSDNAGNTNPGIDSAAFKIDLTKPSVNVTNVDGGATYTYGDVPTPGCNTTDALSGVQTDATVNVTGGTGGFGTFTATCSGAEDNADNPQDGPVSVTYGVKAAFDGFLQPIDGHAVNTGKYGRTYPIKWQLRDSSGALISDSAAQLLVATMTGGQKAVSCTSFDLTDTDALEASTTGNTALRYDATSDQFIYNYKAPSSGTCYVFAIRNADGLTTQQIDFKFTK
jgi:hypothetical protein